MQNRDFRSVENVAEIRESAARVKSWFRALGVELNENVLLSARDDDENEMDIFFVFLARETLTTTSTHSCSKVRDFL